MVTVLDTVRRNYAGMLMWLHSREAAKIRAAGYSTTQDLITTAYLACGRLRFERPMK